MTAELTDERLAELRTMTFVGCGGRDPCTECDLDIALNELQAYRAKRETHVWVPREPTVSIRDALYSWDVDSNPTAYERWAELLRLAILAASDGNPP